MELTVRNDSGFEIIVNRSLFNVSYERLRSIPAGGKHILKYDPQNRFDQFEIFSFQLAASKEVLSGEVLSSPSVVWLSPPHLDDFREFRICLAPDTRGLRWEGILLRNATESAGLTSAKNDVSSKIATALKSCGSLKKFLEAVKICPNRCNHLVQTYVDRIQKIPHLYSRLAEDSTEILYFYRRGSLTQLYNYLDKLEYLYCDAKDLIKACAEEIGRIALVVSVPNMPSVEKDMEICSNFDLLFRELMWNLDLIENELQPTNVTLEWCPNVHRYVLKPTDRSRNVVVGETSVEAKPSMCEDVRSLARKDREHLLSSLEGGSISIPDSPFSRFPWQFNGPVQKDTLNNIIIERCKLEIMQSSLGNLRSLSVDPKCFRIDHLHLKPNTRRVLGSGSYKNTYEGEWCGQRVAIATVRDFEFEQLENEVKQLIGLQHPKVVSFYGWAYTDDAPPPIKTPEEVNHNLKCKGGYIVTEKMECDLEHLINSIRRGATIKRDSGGPFSLSVGLDILLQIVEAMLHVHKQGVMHRDLKPKNFLVNSKSSPRPSTDKFYDVKLIDFGSSRLFGEDKNTYDRGTTRYEAPEMMKGTDVEWKGKYDQSVDVFGFAMTCYQVITGIEPFRNTVPRQKILEGERPFIPATILSGLKELMEACWAENPCERPTFEVIQERLWTIKKELAVPPM